MKKIVPKNQKGDYLSKFDDRRPAGYPPESEFPPIIVLKRKAIRVYPDNQKIALYYSQALDKYISIPIGPNNKAMGIYMNEEKETKGTDLDTRKLPREVSRHYESFMKKHLTPEVYSEYKKAKKEKNEHVAFLEAMRFVHESGRFNELHPEIRQKAHTLIAKSLGQVEPKNAREYLGILGAQHGQQIRAWLAGRKAKKMKGTVPETPQVKQTKPETETPMEEPKTEKPFVPVSKRPRAKQDMKPVKQKPRPIKQPKGPKLVKESFESKLISLREHQQIDEAIPLAIPAAMAVGRALAPAAIKGAGNLAKLGKKYYREYMRKRKTKQKQKESVLGGDKKSFEKGAKPKGIRGALSRAGGVLGGAGKLAGSVVSGIGSTKLTDLIPAEIQNMLVQKALGSPEAIVPGASASGAWTRATQGFPVQSRSLTESTIDTLNFMIENDIKKYPLTINERTITVNKSIAKKIVNVYESLNKRNKKKARKMLNESVESFRNFTNFALRYQ